MNEDDTTTDGLKLACEDCGEPFCVDKCAMGYCWIPECGAESWVWVAEFKKKETP